MDDCIYYYTSENLGRWFVDALGKRFNVTFLGHAHWLIIIRITQNVDVSVSADQSRYFLAIVNKYLSHAMVRAIDKHHNRFLPCDMIFKKGDASEIGVQVEDLMRKYNVYYRACIGALIYLMATRIDISFPVSKLAKFSANPG